MAVCIILLWVVATAQLAWLIFRYVPLHAAIIDGMGMPNARGAMVLNVAANWTIRALPFLILASLPVGALVFLGIALLLRKVTLRSVARVLAAVALTVVLAEVFASTYIVHVIQDVYAAAATSEEYQRGLRELMELRSRSTPASPPPANVP